MIHIFIVNPYAGQKTFADDLRSKLAGMKGLNYFVFNTRYAGYETEVIKKIQHIFQDEKLRFYCCGGSGTMRNMLNGFEDLSEAEVAFFPCGLTNDFLRVFGEDEQRFHQIEELIHGDVVLVDYIQTNHGVALNTFSCGFDSDTVGKFEEYRILSAFGKQVPYFLSLMYALFVSKLQEYEVSVDDSTLVGRFAEVFFGNGNIFGGNMYFADSTCVNDGEGIYMVAPPVIGFGTMPIINALMANDTKKLEKMTHWGASKTIHIRRRDGKPFAVNFDGELVKCHEEWEAKIVRQGLHLVVPKGVKV